MYQLNYPDKNINLSNAKAFEFLFKENFAPLVRYAAEIVKDQDVAEEIVENSFVNYWENLESINTSPLQYLYKSVYNSCLNYLKHIGIENNYKLYFHNYIVPREMEDQQHHYPLNRLMTEELQTLLQKTINELPDQCRKVFELSRYENLTNEEISKNLNMTINTVKTHIGRALKKLRETLQHYRDFLLL